MSGDAITREEMKAMIDVQVKNTEQMVIIAQRLQTIAEQNENTIGLLRNGLADKIVTGIKEYCGDKMDGIDKSIKYNKDKIENINSGISWLKILFGITGLVVTIAAVILKVTGH